MTDIDRIERIAHKLASILSDEDCTFGEAARIVVELEKLLCNCKFACTRDSKDFYKVGKPHH
jgi:hypothetical protein